MEECSTALSEYPIPQQKPVDLYPPVLCDRDKEGCLFCHDYGTRLVCSKDAMMAQRKFLEHFYRRRWRVQNAVSTPDRLSFTQKNPCEIRACEHCGLLSRMPQPKPESVTRAYQNDDYDDAYLRSEWATQREWFRFKIPTVMRHLAPLSKRRIPRVLEIGSFVGGFLAEGLAAGWDMLGVDPGHDVVAFCRSRGLPVLEGTVSEVKLTLVFDAVAVWNTFDQVPAPDDLLQAIAPLVRPGGLLIIRVPNGACFDHAMRTRTTASRGIRHVLDIALAWNNLLTFPYLRGYSTTHIDGLTHRHGFRRKSIYPDTLASTPPGHLKWWASLEERGVKSLCRIGESVSKSLDMVPWLDLYFERSPVPL